MKRHLFDLLGALEKADPTQKYAQLGFDPLTQLAKVYPMTRITTLVNIFGGPGSGKSTLAAGIVHELKLRGYEAVLVHEEFKALAIAGEGSDEADRLEVFARQCKNERRFYGLAQFVVTDSPLEINAFYNDASHSGQPYTRIVERLRAQGPPVIREDFWLDRVVKYDTAGRIHSEAEAHQVDDSLEGALASAGIETTKIGLCPGIATDIILKEFSLES